MKIALIFVIISIFIYLSYCIYRQAGAIKYRKSQINLAKKKYNNAIQETLVSKKELLNNILEIFGQNDVDRVNENKIYIGMNDKLLLASWGRPSEIKDSVIRGKLIEKYYYRPYINRLGNTKYKFEITLEEYIITGWKDLI